MAERQPPPFSAKQPEELKARMVAKHLQKYREMYKRQFGRYPDAPQAGKALTQNDPATSESPDPRSSS